jgi:hypothetical protein
VCVCVHVHAHISIVDVYNNIKTDVCSSCINSSNIIHGSNAVVCDMLSYGASVHSIQQLTIL